MFMTFHYRFSASLLLPGVTALALSLAAPALACNIGEVAIFGAKDDLGCSSSLTVGTRVGPVKPIGQGERNTFYNVRSNIIDGGTEGPNFYYIPIESEIQSAGAGTTGLVALGGYAQTSNAQIPWGLNTNAIFNPGASATNGYS